jgi:hypothetical protein
VTHHSIVLEPDGPGSYKFKFATERGEIAGRVRVEWKDLPTIAPADRERAALNQILAVSREFAQARGD